MTRSTARKSSATKTPKSVRSRHDKQPDIVVSQRGIKGVDEAIIEVKAAVEAAMRPQVLVQGTAVPVIPFRTEVLIAAVGSATAAAELLGVAKSQPTRWRKGEAVPSPEKARLLNDLEHVFSRASMIFEPPVIKDWMTGSNDYLEGARPIDVLRTRGASEVLDALDAAEQIAFGG